MWLLVSFSDRSLHLHPLISRNIKSQTCHILMRTIVTAEAHLLWQLSGLHFPGGVRSPAVDCHSYAEQQRHRQDTYSHCKSCHNTFKRDFFFKL